MSDVRNDLTCSAVADRASRLAVSTLVVVASLWLASGAAIADEPAPSSARVQGSSDPETTQATAPYPTPGAVTSRQPLLPGYQVVPRGPNLRLRCNREALNRKYRGAERRHFVRRCVLGYGRRLFRRRSAVPS